MTVLALGSSKVLKFQGGPPKWSLDDNDHKKEATSTNEEIVKICE